MIMKFPPKFKAQKQGGGKYYRGYYFQYPCDGKICHALVITQRVPYVSPPKFKIKYIYIDPDTLEEVYDGE